MYVFSYKQRNNLVLAIIIVLALIILYSIRDLFPALLGSIILYAMFKSIYIYLRNRLGKIGSALVVIVSSFVIIVIPFFILSIMVVNRLASLQQDQFRVKAMISRLDDYIGLKLNKPGLIDHYISNFSDYVQDLFPSVVSGALSVFVTIAVMYFILYFMLVQSDAMEEGLIKYSPLRTHHTIQFGEELKNTTYSNILGQGLIALVQGMLVSICFFIVGIDDAIFWGIISLFLSFMPIIGAPIITFPAALILYLNGDHWQGTFILLFTIIVIINIDNVIRFIISKKLADMHPMITVIGVIIGLPLFGFSGLVFGPLILSWFLNLIKIYEMDKSTETRLGQLNTDNQ